MKRIVLTSLFMLGLAAAVFADQEAGPFPYKAVTADRKYIFVVTDPKCGLCGIDGDYKQSGMYRNDGSTAPLWTVDWMNRIFLPNDGRHVVRLGRWARYSATYREELFTFVEEGRVLKTYTTVELVDFPYLLPHSVSHYGVFYGPMDPDQPGDGAVVKYDNGAGYPVNSGATFDNQQNTLRIETHNGDTYLFDLNTGAILSARRPARTTAVLLAALLIVLYSVFLLIAARVHSVRKHPRITAFAGGFALVFGLFMIPLVAVALNAPVHLDDWSRITEYFWSYAYLQISMLPRYLLASLGVLALPENYCITTDWTMTLEWLALFWLPLALLFGFINRFVIGFFSRESRVESRELV
ncbi:MAG: hypothetical protein JSS81_27500 [Acidobacteria bacterium]|nr:hypothetical protein [Acidobacteriota bacterium]